jgi:hypothetical protein
VCREAAVHILLNIVRGIEPGQPRSLPVLPRELGSGPSYFWSRLLEA